MPPPGMQGDTELMTNAATEAGSTASTLDTLLTNLMDQLSPLLTAWRGDGGTAFQNVRLAVEEEMRNLNSALHFLSDEVAATSVDYTNTDAEMADDMVAAGASAGDIARSLMRE